MSHGSQLQQQHLEQERRIPVRSWADEDEDEADSDGSFSLSFCSLLFIALIAGLCLWLVGKDAGNIFLLPGFFIPPVLTLWFFWYRKLRKEIPFDLVLGSFASGFVPGAVIVMIVESILTVIFFLVCFLDQAPAWIDKLQDILESEINRKGRAWMATGSGAERVVHFIWSMRRDAFWGLRRGGEGEGGGEGDLISVIEKEYGITIRKSVGFYLFLALLAYVVAAGTEETMKYCVPLRFKRCVHSKSKYAYLICSLSAALGFSCMENVGYAMGATDSVGQSTLSSRAITAYSRAFIATAAHGVCGGIVGAGLTQRHVLGANIRYLHIIFPPVVVHGTFDFQQFLLMLYVMDETAQTAAATVLDILVLVVAAVYLRRRVRGMQLDVGVVQGQQVAAVNGGVNVGEDTAGDNAHLLDARV